ncbi:hypothetical protein HY416_01885 [Candidatus Kaiserbacteria bacterium]|nr:hypothetical protein [Candidatus Kaiserbacteria bacterium]
MNTTSTISKHSMIDRMLGFAEGLSIGDRFLLKIAAVAFFLSFLWLAVSVNARALVVVPGRGGTLTEGVVGAPRFVNPVLAVTVADQDLTALVYAGLVARNTDGQLVPDIAESIEVSEDGRTYRLVLRQDVVFHDATPLTADDVVFTVSRVQDPAVKSPLRASWEGVAVERQGEHEIQFLLPEPYAPFIENLTLGILPKHIWEGVSAEEFPFSQYNSEPVGAGPYAISEVSRTDAGIPESYELVSNRRFFKTPPRIKKLYLRFYQTESELVDAIMQGVVESAGGLSETALDTISVAQVPITRVSAPLPRTFMLFFNQNEVPMFRESAVRKALQIVVNRQVIVEEALDGAGIAITSPIPPGFEIETPPVAETGDVAALDEARAILRDAGWRMHEETGRWEKTIDGTATELSFSISTVNTPVFEETAEILKSQWAELGVPVTIEQFEQSDLVQTTIRPRQYETLLFGTVVGRELDFYSFWHSSQRNDPGLNVALYANIATDSLLSAARAGGTSEERAVLYQKFSDTLADEIPAIFLYVPTYAYVAPPAVRNVSLAGIARGSERWSTVHDWFIETNTVWPFFADNEEQEE